MSFPTQQVLKKYLQKHLCSEFPHVPVTKPDILVKKIIITLACAFFQQMPKCLLWARHRAGARDEQWTKQNYDD